MHFLQAQVKHGRFFPAIHRGAKTCSSFDTAELMLLLSSIISNWCDINPLILLSIILAKLSLYGFWFIELAKCVFCFSLINWLQSTLEWLNFVILYKVLNCSEQNLIKFFFYIYFVISISEFFFSGFLKISQILLSKKILFHILNLPQPTNSSDRLKSLTVVLLKITLTNRLFCEDHKCLLNMWQFYSRSLQTFSLIFRVVV